MILAIYYISLTAIHYTTHFLQGNCCHHCKQIGYLRSHGFVYRKQAVGRDWLAVGKRVFCSNRYGNRGCGRTVQLRLDDGLVYLHYHALCLTAFIMSLLAGALIKEAYFRATGTMDPRNAYRWLNKLMVMLPEYRATFSQLPEPALRDNPRQALLCSTFSGLLLRFGAVFIASFQHDRQRSFIRY